MGRNRIKLSDHFTYGRLGRFVLPSIAMMIFTSIYGIVDGLFVSNFVGTTAFAAVNLIMPFIMMCSALGFMIGTGGSAFVAQLLGEKRKDEAQQVFTMLHGALFFGAVILSALSAIFMPEIAHLLGGEGKLLEDAVLYGRLSMISLPFFMLQNSFQSFMVAAEKPRLGLAVMVAAGVCNMVMDFVLIGLLGWGVSGAATATVLSEYVGGLVPILYFSRRNDSLLRFVKSRFDGKTLAKVCGNGFSELMTNIAGPVLGMIYNLQLLHYIGEDGVAAYGVIMYVNFIFSAIYFGYMIGSAPLFAYHYAAGTYRELQNLYHKSLRLFAVFGVALCALSWLLAPPLTGIFVGYDPQLHALTVHAMRIISPLFLLIGFAVFGSGFFTALGNGMLSAILSFLRMLVFQLAAVLLMPLLWGVEGIWLSSVVANAFSVALTVWILRRNKAKYHY